MWSASSPLTGTKAVGAVRSHAAPRYTIAGKIRTAAVLRTVRIVLLLRRELHVVMRQTHEGCHGVLSVAALQRYTSSGEVWWLRELLPERSVQTWCRGLSAIARRTVAATTQHRWERSYGLPDALAQRATARTSPLPPARQPATRAAR